MRRNHDYEPDPKADRDDDGDLEIGRAHEPREDERRREVAGLPYNYEDADGAQRVGFRPNPLPAREEDEEEIAEADIMEVLDDDDLNHMDGPDA
jgi:hypothetical protein